MHRVRTLSRGLLAAALLLHAFTALVVIGLRIRHPHDLEWMTGSVLDHVERVRMGEPLYTAPSARWIPFLYTPLFYWLGAVVGGGAFACRLISVVASIAQGVFVWWAARALGAKKAWAAAAVLVFVAAFPFVGFWYDLERGDNLCGALVMAGACALLRARSVRGHVLSGFLFVIAVLAKQQAIFYLAGSGLGLLLAKRASDEPTRNRDLAGFGLAAGLPLVALLALARAGDGWPSYYLVKMPRAHGVVLGLADAVIWRDVPRGFLLVGVTVGATAVAALHVLRRTGGRRDTIAAAILITGFAGAVASRLHIGGWINVLIPWSTCAAVAVGVTASRVEERFRTLAWIGLATAGAVLLQLLVWTYDPRPLVPSAASRADEERLRSEIAMLERNGEVLIPSRGHISRVRHFHISALADVVRVDGHSPADLVSALRSRSYAAVVDDARYHDFRTDDWPPTLLEDIDDLRTPLLSSYFVARRLAYGRRRLALQSPATPAWVYLPRRVPLDVAPAELRRRQLAEMRLADVRARALAEGSEAPFTESEIEDLASLPEPAPTP
ncbi:MAG: hypothetical protein JWO86_6123 [Myxococcaceae bacterium]|nr:hypothetical protein [Myxococcaceae bacterium]